MKIINLIYLLVFDSFKCANDPHYMDPRIQHLSQQNGKLGQMLESDNFCMGTFNEYPKDILQNAAKKEIEKNTEEINKLLSGYRSIEKTHTGRARRSKNSGGRM